VIGAVSLIRRVSDKIPLLERPLVAAGASGLLVVMYTVALLVALRPAIHA
jgi:hypothetical protein